MNRCRITQEGWQDSLPGIRSASEVCSVQMTGGCGIHCGHPRENTMKKLGLVLLLFAALASPAMAAPTQIQIGYDYTADGLKGPYLNPVAGGEFTFNPLTGWLTLTGYVSGKTSDIGVAGTFQTFCLEASQSLGTYPEIYNAGLSEMSSDGNVVSVGTGYLYSQFAMGSLAGYDYVNLAGRKDSAYALQQTIWWLEGFTVDPGTGNAFRNAVVGMFADPMADGGSEFGVYALNMWTLEGVDVQDGLVFVPDGGATLMLLGGALMGLGALRRKFRG
jgi:hypothetical protein